MPGYIVKIKVKSLKPFQATEFIRTVWKAQGATAERKSDVKRKNSYINSTSNAKTNTAFKMEKKLK